MHDSDINQANTICINRRCARWTLCCCSIYINLMAFNSNLCLTFYRNLIFILILYWNVTFFTSKSWILLQSLILLKDCCCHFYIKVTQPLHDATRFWKGRMLRVGKIETIFHSGGRWSCILWIPTNISSGSEKYVLMDVTNNQPDSSSGLF